MLHYCSAKPAFLRKLIEKKVYQLMLVNLNHKDRNHLEHSLS